MLTGLLAAMAVAVSTPAPDYVVLPHDSRGIWIDAWDRASVTKTSDGYRVDMIRVGFEYTGSENNKQKFRLTHSQDTVTLSCDWRTVERAKPARDSDKPSPPSFVSAWQPETEVLEHLCQDRILPDAPGFGSIAALEDHARAEITDPVLYPPGMSPPDPPPALDADLTFSSIAREPTLDHVAFLDWKTMARRDGKAYARTLTVLGPASSPSSTSLALRDVVFDCKAGTFTVVRETRWTRNNRFVTRESDQTLAGRMDRLAKGVDAQLLNAACRGKKPKNLIKGIPAAIATVG